MGQEHSSHSSQHTRHRAREKPVSSSERPHDFQPHRKRAVRNRSTSDLDLKSDNSSTESSGYRSGSNSAYDYRSTSERSSASSEYYHLSLYKNDHYKEINRELYKPVKLSKDKRHRLLIDVEKDKYTVEKDKYTVGKDNNSAEKDKYSGEKDKHSVGKDKYSVDRDKYSAPKDKHTAEKDKYPAGKDKNSVGKDKYSDKNRSIKSYLSDTDSNLQSAGMTETKKSGIRNYTPKILGEEEQKKKIENWI